MPRIAQNVKDTPTQDLNIKAELHQILTFNMGAIPDKPGQAWSHIPSVHHLILHEISHCLVNFGTKGLCEQTVGIGNICH